MNIKKYVGALNKHSLIRKNQVPLDLNIRGISSNSKKTKQGNIFVAIKGLTADGHEFASEAIEKGASALVIEKEPQKNFPYIQVKDTRKALACLWATYYKNPQKHLKIIGVTGTDGKTTTSYLIHKFLKEGGYKSGLISTVKATWSKNKISTGQHVSTPEPRNLFKILSKMVKDNCTHVVLETTSHGLAQDRVFGINFEVGVLTNFTPEHLDYHHTLENYKKAKAKLFQNAKTTIINNNDPNANYFIKKSKGDVKTYNPKEDTLGLAYDKEKLPGDYNYANILAARLAAKTFGVADKDIQKGLENFVPPEGRFHEVEANQPFKIIIDFAHTPNALKNLLFTVSKKKKENAKIICVFGCEGERDKGKRYPMGKIAAKYANISILTAVDPRSESLEKINQTIARGAATEGGKIVTQKNIKNTSHKEKKKSFFINIPKRREAIKLALSLARVGDWVLVLGKGHEKTMNLGSGEVPWCDQQAIENSLANLKT